MIKDLFDSFHVKNRFNNLTSKQNVKKKWRNRVASDISTLLDKRKKIKEMSIMLKEEGEHITEKRGKTMWYREKIAREMNTPKFYMWLIKAMMTDIKSVPEQFKNIISNDDLKATKKIFEEEITEDEIQEKLATLHKFSREGQEESFEAMRKLAKLLGKRTGFKFAVDHIFPLMV